MDEKKVKKKIRKNLELRGRKARGEFVMLTNPKANTPIFDPIRRVIYALDQISADTYKGKVLWYLWQANLVDHKPVQGYTQAVEAFDLHMRLHNRDLRSMGRNEEQEQFVLDHVQTRDLYRYLGLDPSKCATNVSELCKKGMVHRHKRSRHTYLAMEWELIVELYHAFKTGHIVPFKDIDIYHL